MHYIESISPHLISPHLISSHLTSPHLISPHLTSSHLTSPHLTSSHLTSSHLTSSHLISSHLTSPHLISPHHLTSSHLITSPHLTSSHRSHFRFYLRCHCQLLQMSRLLFFCFIISFINVIIYRTDALTKAEERERGFGQCAICMSDNAHTGKETIPHSAARVDFGSPKSSRQSGGDCIEFSIIRIIHRHTARFCPSYERIFSEHFQYHLIFFDSILFLKIN